MEDRTLGHGEPLPVAPSAELQRSVGPYRLLERLGEGGMGEVWLAQQSAPVQRKVALKLIRPGVDSPRLAARFAVERQTLALMEHPAIARVFEGGATPEGRLWFAMELVRGAPITQHCDAQELGLRARIELFIEVCEGVQHAHQKAIIHRDLKPSNVLVSTAEGRAQPKIIDFGIAKATDRRPGNGAPATEAGVLLGTPEYMSPEQADPRCEDLDTRADVYSLGVLLYELFSGALPFSTEQLRGQGLDELRRQIRDVDPPAPSRRLTAPGGEAAAVARRRQTQPEALRRLLRGDLDAITMKAMEKERERRYGTVAGLREDLERFLRHEPVLARKASALYRLRKYARRHRAGVTIGVAVALAVPAFTASLALQVQKVSRERERANRLTEFVTGIFRRSDPSTSGGNSVTAREILDKASADIDAQLTLDPELRAAMMHTMGRAYWFLGLYPKAQSLLERAIEIRRRALGAGHRDTLSSMTALGQVQFYDGRSEEAEKTLRTALAGQRRVFGPDDQDIIRTMDTLALALARRGQFEEAERLQREAFAKQRRLLGPEHPDTLAVMGNLSITLFRAGRYEDAAALGREALALAQHALGPEHPLTMRAGLNLANSLSAGGHLEEAEQLQRQNLEVTRRVQGPEHPQALRAMSNLGELLYQQGKLVESEKALSELLAIRRRILGPAHPETLLAMEELANTLSAEGRFAEAEPLAREAFEADKRLHGDSDPGTLLAMASLAAAREGLGRLAEARGLYRELLDRSQKTLGPKHPDTLSAMIGLAEALDAAGEHAGAKKLLDEALGLQSDLSPGHPATATTRYRLACNAALSGRRAEALELLRQAVGHGLPALLAARAATDPALVSLHGDPDFEALTGEVSRTARR